MITANLLMESGACSAGKAQEWFQALDDAATKYQIDNDKRVAMFIAQLGHESGGFAFTAENLNYSAATVSTAASGRSTNSTKAIGALSP